MNEKDKTPQDDAGHVDELLIKKYFFDAGLTCNSTADLNGNLNYVNPTFLKTWGYARKEEVLGRPISHFLVYPAEIAAILSTLEKTGRWEGEYTAIKGDGSTFIAHGLASVLKDDSGKLIGYQSSVIDVTEQKKTLEALKDSYLINQAIFQSANEGIIVRGLDLKILTWNPFMERLTRIKAEENIGKLPEEYHHDAASTVLMKHLKSALAGQTTNNIEFEFNIKKTGRSGWTANNFSPLRNAKGEIIGVITTVRDITAQKLLQEEIKASYRLSEDIISSVNEGIVVHGPDFKARIWNPFMEKLTGLKSESVIGKTPGEILPYPLSQIISENIKAALSGNKVTNIEFPFDFPTTGFSGWTLNSFSPLSDSQGAVTGVICSVHDITAYKRSEESRLENERKYKLLIETTNTGFVSIDTEGRVRDANQEYIRMTGHSKLEEILGRPVTDWTAPYDLARNAEAVKQCAKDGVIRNFNVDYIHADGKIVPIEVHATVLKDGDSPQIITICRDITEKKTSEKMLQESENKYRTLVETTSEWIWQIDLNGRHIFSNNGVLHILGYGAKEFMDIDYFQLLHEDDRKEIESSLPGLIAEKKGWTGWVLRWKHKDGTYRYLESSARPVLNTSGELIGFIGADRDVTERRQALLDLNNMTDRLEAIAGNLAQGMVYQVTCTPDLSRRWFSYVNQAVERLHGLKAEEVLKDHMLIYNQILEEDREYVAQKELVAFNTKTKLDVEARIRLPDGRICWRHFISAPRTLDDGYVVWDGIELDISGRKAAEEAFRKQNEELKHLQSIIDHSDSMAFVSEKNGDIWDITYASRNVETKLGYTPHDFTSGKLHWPDIVHPDDFPRLMKEIAAVREKGENIWSQEFRLITRSGEVKWFRDNNFLTIAPDGKKTVHAVAHDITIFVKAGEELQKQQQHLIHMERVSRMGELASSIAHEINQPLLGIRSNAQAAMKSLARKKPSVKNVADMLSNIVADEKRASEVIKGLRVLLRKETPARRANDINLLIDEVLKLIRKEMLEHNIAIVTKLEKDLPLVKVDPIQIQQVLLNLMINAQQAMEGIQRKDKEIRITSFTDAMHNVIIWVEDNGPGLDKMLLEKIFDPFYTTKEHGMGMGLAICRSIIESHQGKIWADKEQIGGTKISLCLPTVQRGDE